MIEETMKMPDPIIDPATSIVESSKPSPRTNFWSSAAGGCDMRLRSSRPIRGRVNHQSA
jgi:hypothetical protein